MIEEKVNFIFDGAINILLIQSITQKTDPRKMLGLEIYTNYHDVNFYFSYFFFEVNPFSASLWIKLYEKELYIFTRILVDLAS